MVFNKNHTTKNKTMRSSYLLLILLGIPAFVKGQENDTNATSLSTNTTSPLLNANTSSPVSIPSTLSPSQTPSAMWNETEANYGEIFILPLIPPWGEPAFGFDLDHLSYYNSGITNFEDTRHYGWSWLPSYLHKSAPFCYERDPRPFWADSGITSGPAKVCYPITSQCDALGGTVFNNVLCIEDPAKPFTVVGPVCWNQTCYNQDTFAACKAVGGQFIGGQYDSTFNASKFYESLLLQDFNEIAQAYWDNKPISDAAWCAVPGKHTLIGPTCYGQECFKDELAAVCNTTLKGTTFADIFCLVDDTYTVIGPICTPNSINVTHNTSVCYPDETVKLCEEIEGTSIGDIFCVVKGDYSVLGPFCQITHFRSGYEVDEKFFYPECYDASNACNSLGGTALGNGAFCVLKGEYSFVRPDGPCCSQDTGDDVSWCEKQGGRKIVNQPFDNSNNEFGCIFKGKYSTIGPMSWGKYGSTYLIGDEIGGNIVESNIIHSRNSGYVILKGEYSVYGPSCFDDSCYINSNDCLSAGGATFGGVFCAVADDGTGKIMKKDTTSDTTSDAMYNHIDSTPVPFILFMLVSYKIILGNI